MSNRNGFSIIEVLVAVLVMAGGILGMATTAALVTRMIGQGQRFSEVSAVAAQRFEVLRSRPCASRVAGSTTQGPYALAWSVDPVAAGKAQSVQLIVISPTSRAARADTFATTVSCW